MYSTFSTISHMLNRMAQKPADYRFVWIYGPSGAGKSHLLKRYYEKQQKYGLKAACVDMEQLMEQFILESSTEPRDTNKIFNKFKELDILIIDDCNILRERPGMQEMIFGEFIRINKETGLRVIVTTTLLPKNMPVMEEIFSDHGMIIDIELPTDHEKKIVMLRELKKRGIVISEDIAEFISSQLKTFGEVMGVVNRIVLERKISWIF